jgi:hypothetical protein
MANLSSRSHIPASSSRVVSPVGASAVASRNNGYLVQPAEAAGDGAEHRQRFRWFAAANDTVERSMRVFEGRRYPRMAGLVNGQRVVVGYQDVVRFESDRVVERSDGFGRPVRHGQPLVNAYHSARLVGSCACTTSRHQSGRTELVK